MPRLAEIAFAVAIRRLLQPGTLFRERDGGRGRGRPAAQTAFGPMVLAAVEQHEPPHRRLVDDDLASAFLPTKLRWLVAATRWRLLRRLMIGASERSGPGLWTNLACRKRYIDDKLFESIGSIDAVVVLGAGLDSRAYRLARKSPIPVFEVDLPVNIARKEATVRRVLGAPPASVHLVPVDFEANDLAAILARHGYNAGDRTFFIWEGVTQYLTADAVRAVLEFLARAGSGSRLVFTYVREDFIDGRNMYGASTLYRRTRGRRTLWHSGLMPDEVPAVLAKYGWQVIEQAGPDYLLEHYVRPAGRDLPASQIEWSVYAQLRPGVG
jgi:methyltransferase (TIGR00027 family)